MELDPERIPKHVAIIMDGNGRWAKARNKPRLRGHEEGVNSVRAITRACRNFGVEYLTLYAFSSENWVRPKPEISGLMRLLHTFLTKNEYEFHDNQLRFRVIGRIEQLPNRVQREIKRVMEATAHYTEGTLVLALNYGARAELVDAAKGLAEKVKAGELAPDAIDEALFERHLYAPDIPHPDLLIRTSGEERLSNFLLWQLSYAEFYFTDVYWPDFREEEFKKALVNYQQRHRRFGAVC